MLRPNFLNILFFILAKYLAFYFFMIVKNHDFKLFKLDNVSSGSSLSYFIIIMLPLPLISMIIFSMPLYFSFKLKRIILFLMAVFFTILLECAVYVFLTSQNYLDLNGFYNGVIGVVLFIILFYRSIIVKLKRSV